jgi:Leucine-rich repeat (LRR) protein
MLIINGEKIEENEETLLIDRGVRECYVKSDVIVKLWLSNNQLTSFTTGELPNLRVLYLSNNQLTSFTTGNLPNLQGLGLSNNQLTSFTTGELPNLRVLYLYDNHLTSFTSGDLPNLQRLYLSNNQLTSFTTGDLLNLQHLYLSNNQLTSFASGNLPNLKRLWLYNNPLSVLYLGTWQVPSLRILNLSNTQVKFIDPSLEKFANEKIKVRAHLLNLSEMLISAFEIDNHPVLEEIREHIEV